jgi:hypothetical protein
MHSHFTQRSAGSHTIAIVLLQLQDLSLKPGEQGSLQYKFKPDRMLQPREFLVALHVFYNVRAADALLTSQSFLHMNES